MEKEVTVKELMDVIYNNLELYNSEYKKVEKAFTKLLASKK